jgi:hypothetical protein
LPAYLEAAGKFFADQAEGGSAKSHLKIVESLECGRASVERARQQFAQDGLEAVLNPSRANGSAIERWTAKRRRTWRVGVRRPAGRTLALDATLLAEK